MWNNDGQWNVLYMLNDFLLAYVKTVQDPALISELISCNFNGLDTNKINRNYFCVNPIYDQFATNFLKILCDLSKRLLIRIKLV